MAQEKFKISGVEVAQPTEYTPQLATTSTADSKRDMSLLMHNTPIGTVEAYSLKWKYINVHDAAQILQLIVNKGKYTAHYLDAYTGTWKDDEFYTANMSMGAKTLKEGHECWKDFSLQITRTKPV